MPRRKTRNHGAQFTNFFDFHGHTTFVYQLAHIFKLNAHTLTGRVKSKWPLEAALVANTTSGWHVNNIDEIVNQDWLVPYVQHKMDIAFNSKSPRRFVRPTESSTVPLVSLTDAVQKDAHRTEKNMSAGSPVISVPTTPTPKTLDVVTQKTTSTIPVKTGDTVTLSIEQLAQLIKALK